MTNPSNAKSNLAAAIARFIFVFLVLAIPAFMLAPPAAMQQFDFPEFYAPGRMVLQSNSARVYDVAALKIEQWRDFPVLQSKDRFVVLYLPPPALLLLAPIALLPAVWAAWTWWVSTLLSWAGSTAILSKLAGLSDKAFVRIATGLAAFGPQWETIKHGQIAAFLLLVFSVSSICLQRGQLIPAALCLAVCMLKPQLFLPFLAFFAGARQFRLIAYVVLFCVLGTIVSFLIFGAQTFENYSALMSQSMLNRQWMAPEAGPTVRGQILRILPNSDSSALLIGGIVLAGCLALSFWLGTRQRKSPLDAALLCTLPLGLWTSLHLHSYDVVFLLPSFLIGIKYKLWSQFQLTEKVLIVLSLGIFFMPFYNKLHYEYLLSGGIFNPFLAALIAISAIAFKYSRQLEVEESSQPTEE